MTHLPVQRSLFVLVVLAVAGGGALAAQEAEGPTLVPVAGPFYADVDLRDLPLAPGWQPGDPIVIIPEGYLDEETLVEAPFTSEAWGAFREAPATAEGIDGVFSVNREGIPFTGVSPPDTVGDAGPDHYIQMTNRSGGSNVLVLDKQGNTLAGPFDLDSLWMGGGPCDNGLGDPVVVYDQLADRWVLTEFASSGNHFCIYVSQTADPVSGGWFLYDVTTPQFPDYPKYGVWPDAYYVTTFESPNLGVYALDRTAMLAGAPTTSIRFTLPALLEAPRSTRLLPGHFEGGDTPPAGFPNPLFRTVEAAQDPGNPTDRLEVHHYHVDFAVPANSTFTLESTIGISDFSFPDCTNPVPPRSCVPQPNTTNKVDALPGRSIVQSSLRHDKDAGLLTMTDTEAEDAGGGVWGQRWWRLTLGLDTVEGGWSLAEEGLYSPDAVHRWMGSIAMNGDGDMALGYSVSDATSTFPGVRVAGRLATDPAGTLPIGEYTAVDGTGSQTSNQRWGDYSSMSVDPADDESFWYTQEYIPANGLWTTRIVAFGLATIFTDGFESGDTSAWDVTTN
jgi:hypothetical protein